MNASASTDLSSRLRRNAASFLHALIWNTKNPIRCAVLAVTLACFTLQTVAGEWITHTTSHCSQLIKSEIKTYTENTHRDFYSEQLGSVEQFDADLGFYFLRARYMNPASGRFFTMDTYEGSSGDPMSLHKYLYCASNPIGNIDPSGNSFLGITASVAKIALLTSLTFTAVHATYHAIKGDLSATEIMASSALVFATTFGSLVSAPVAVGLLLLGVGAAIYKGWSSFDHLDPVEIGVNIVVAILLAAVLKQPGAAAAASGGSSAARQIGLSEVRHGVADVLAPFVRAIRKAVPDAKIGYRGSLSRGVKGPHKGNAPFDPGDFDVDAFIVSDILAEGAKSQRGFRSGNQVQALGQYAKEIQSALKERFPGLRDGFTFRIYSSREFAKKAGNDAYTILD